MDYNEIELLRNIQKDVHYIAYGDGNGDGFGDGNGDGSNAGSGNGTAKGGFLQKIGRINSALDHTKYLLKGMYNDVKYMVEPWAAVDNAASKYAKTIAMTEAGMKRLRKTTIDNVVSAKIGINYNVSPEDLIEFQSKYNQIVGRALRIDNTQQESLAAMHAVMDGREIELAAAFENFGVSLNGVADHAGKMFADASKQGLSFEKYSDNVAKNIKIAQNYTFKNGLKGLESMAKKATAIKLDMGQVANFAEKVSNIEGAIDVASKLQVLGGSFASIADPLGMLNEGLMDMEGLTDRVINMVGGMGAFNKQTGEVEVSAFNKQRIKAAAQAMGMDYSQLMESVNAGAKREEIKRQISASSNAVGLNNDMKELLKNSATFNEEGKAGVSINGVFKTLDQLSDNDYEDLVKETQDQAADIKDIAKTLRSFKDMEEGTRKQYRAAKAQIAEHTGLGDGVKNLVKLAGRQTWLLGLIATGSIIKGFLGIFSKGAQLFGGWGHFLKGGSFMKGMNNAVGSAANRISGAAGRFGTSVGKAAFVERLGSVGLQANEKLFNVGSKLATKNGLIGNAGTKIAEKAIAREAIVSTATKQATGKAAAQLTSQEMAKTAGAKILANGAKGLGVGLAFGLAGTGLDLWKDNLVRKGKIKEGGFAHGAMTIGSSALQGAGWGSALGVPGMIAGALIGATVGAVKLVKQKRERIVDAQLEKKGIQRQGKYNARKLKLIDEGLQTGELSNRMRKKLIARGDIAIVEEIEKKKEENKEKRRKNRNELLSSIFGGKGGNIAKGTFTVAQAFFNGEAFNTNIKRNGTYSDEQNKEIDQAIMTGKMSRDLRKLLEENEETEILKAIEDRKKMDKNGLKEKIDKNKFGVAHFEVGVGHFGVKTEKFDEKSEKDRSKIKSILGSVTDFNKFKIGPAALFNGFEKAVIHKLFGDLNGSKKKGNDGISNVKGVPENGFNPEIKTLGKTKQNEASELQNNKNLREKSNNFATNGKIDINITGTIKLEGANGKKVEITKELLGNKSFIEEISKLISEKIGAHKVGSLRQDNNVLGRTV